MSKSTGTIILAFIALIFGTDAVIAYTGHQTISEWFYVFLHNDPLIGFTILGGSFAALMAHFWWYRPK